MDKYTLDLIQHLETIKRLISRYNWKIRRPVRRDHIQPTRDRIRDLAQRKEEIFEELKEINKKYS